MEQAIALFKNDMFAFFMPKQATLFSQRDCKLVFEYFTTTYPLLTQTLPALQAPAAFLDDKAGGSHL
jgi:hypothetical protein